MQIFQGCALRKSRACGAFAGRGGILFGELDIFCGDGFFAS
jgi:hypothetical protein